MHLSGATVLLLIGNAIVSAQSCMELPNVPNAQALDRKDAYAKGDSLLLRCDTGYTSGRPIKYICTDEGWISIHSSPCKVKPCVPPDDIPNGYYELINGSDFVFGAIIKYFCDDGYQMASKEATRTCLLTEWSNHLPVCEPLSCDAPPPSPGVSVQGLPNDEGPILPDRFLVFSCDAPGSTLNGSDTLICGRDGKWDKPFPNCVGRCDVGQVPDGVSISPGEVRQFQIGQSLNFVCKTRGHVLRGERQVTCLKDGVWSHPFPSCSDPRSCGSPPPLDNGDFITSGMFGHNSRVQYQCQSKYTMQGGPYKTCLNGVWTGEIKCLKPCTVNPDLMVPNKIQFKWNDKNKLYAPHKDHITFTCIEDATHDGVEEMRQICLDGVMILPKCV